MLATFAADAIVSDEQRHHVGQAEIRDWIQSATIASTWSSHQRVLGWRMASPSSRGPSRGGFQAARCLTFRFSMQDDLISALEIG